VHDFLQVTKEGDMSFPSGLTVSVAGDASQKLTWKSAHGMYKTERCSWQISFCLSSDEQEGCEDGPLAVCQLSTGCRDKYRRLSVLITQTGKNEAAREVLHLELRRVNQSKGTLKRKRPALELID
jgi:hypothetical protein